MAEAIQCQNCGAIIDADEIEQHWAVECEGD